MLVPIVTIKMKRASADGINISGEKVYAILGEILLDQVSTDVDVTSASGSSKGS
jgi:hypothetical protein